MGEFLAKSRMAGFKAVVVACFVGTLLIGIVYTGIHNFNLFSRTLPADQQMFAVIPVVLLEGGILLFLAGSFVWFSGGAQKTVAIVAGWVLFAVVAANTLVDSLIASKEALPEWLHLYSTFVMYAMPVAVMAILKLILDLDPAKRALDIQKAMEHALQEAKFASIHRALLSEANRNALTDYGNMFAAAMAQHIRESAPDVIDSTARPTVAQMAKDAPLAEVKEAGEMPKTKSGGSTAQA